MGTVINLICLSVVLVFIIDLSGIVTHIKEWIALYFTNGASRKTNYSIKPFDCSMCMCFWLGLIFIACTGHFTLPYILAVSLLSYSTVTIKNILILIFDILDTIIAKISKKL